MNGLTMTCLHFLAAFFYSPLDAPFLATAARRQQGRCNESGMPHLYRLTVTAEHHELPKDMAQVLQPA